MACHPGVRTHPAFRSSIADCWRNCSEAGGDDAQRDTCTSGCFPGAQAEDRKVGCIVTAGGKCCATSHICKALRLPTHSRSNSSAAAFDCCLPCTLQVVSEAGIDYDEAHVPLLLHAAYGEWPVKMIVMLRNPIERLWTAFHEYGQYKGRYGATPEVLLSSLTETLPCSRVPTKPSQ